MDSSAKPGEARPADLNRANYSDPSAQGIAPVVQRNIAALIEQRRREDAARRTEERVADAISRFTGSMRFVYLHLAFFGTWIVINLNWTPLPKFDPSFVILAMVASVEAIFLSTFVLITQNRHSANAEKRADLDLQISLLAEHEITRLVTLVAAIGEKLQIEEARDPSLGVLKKDVAPEHVLKQLDSTR
jgi:uncharacterized membrane protein